MTSIRDHYQFAVVGNGLIGSAAGRYLSEWSNSSVVIIGPGEPSSAQNNDAVDADDEKGDKTVFSSHYDHGRLCRPVSQDPIWHVINGQAVAKYISLEERSGIRFYDPVGRVKVGRQRTASEQEELLDWMKRTQEQHSKIKFQYFPAGDQSWKQTLFPMLDFPLDCDLFAESAPSGIINPRQLIAAQNAIAQKEGGATILSQLVVKLELSSANDVVRIHLANGKLISADKVLIACGAFTNFNNLLPQPIPLLYKTETTVWGTVSEDTARALQGMPAVTYDMPPQRKTGVIAQETVQPTIDDLYMAPPLLYPDNNGGTYKIKMGCNTIHEQWPTTLVEIQEWFRAGNSDVDLPAMTEALQSQLPAVPFIDFTSHRCIVTYTPSGYPTIDAAPSGQDNDSSHGQERRIFVAGGGNGTSAQGSDTLGHLAARLMYDGRWILDDFGIPRDVFRATNQWGQSRNKLSNAQKRALSLVAVK